MQELPSGYRIITNGTVYRIQKKWLCFWLTQKYFSYGYDSYIPYEFNDRGAAIEYAVLLERDREKEKAASKWRVV